METYFQIAATCAVVLYVVCDTTALEVYLKILFNFLGKKDAAVNPDNTMGLPLITRLRLSKPDSFLYDLVECPVCLGVWFAGISSFLMFGANILAAGASIFLALTFYFILRLFVCVINKYESKDSREV